MGGERAEPAPVSPGTQRGETEIMSDATGGRPSGRTPNAEQQRTVTRQDLPLHCPMPGSTLWDSHPRVYLPIDKTGREQCPYCGTVYMLSDGAAAP